MSSPAGTVTSAEIQSKPVTGRDVAALTGTFLLWFAVMSLVARSTGFSPLIAAMVVAAGWVVVTQRRELTLGAAALRCCVSSSG